MIHVHHRFNSKQLGKPLFEGIGHDQQFFLHNYVVTLSII